MYWNNSFKIFLLIFILSILRSAHGDCGIVKVEKDMPFTFIEVNENLPVKSPLANYTTFDVTSITMSNNSIGSNYIELKYDEDTHEINLSLKKSLSQYREEVWMPSVETIFNLACVSGKMKTITFLVIIEDENINPPMFLNQSYDFKVTFPWPIYSPMNTHPIKITDKDFNRKHSTVDINCEGEDCVYFRFENNLVSVKDGHNYEVNVFLKNDIDYNDFGVIKSGQQFSLLIFASDSIYVSKKVPLTFKTIKVAKSFHFQEVSYFHWVFHVVLVVILATVWIYFACDSKYDGLKNDAEKLRKAISLLSKKQSISRA